MLIVLDVVNTITYECMMYQQKAGRRDHIPPEREPSGKEVTQMLSFVLGLQGFSFIPT